MISGGGCASGGVAVDTRVLDLVVLPLPSFQRAVALGLIARQLPSLPRPESPSRRTSLLKPQHWSVPKAYDTHLTHNSDTTRTPTDDRMRPSQILRSGGPKACPLRYAKPRILCPELTPSTETRPIPRQLGRDWYCSPLTPGDFVRQPVRHPYD